MEIKKNQSLGFLVIVPKQLKFRYEVTNKKKNNPKEKEYQKSENRRQKRQLVSFLNRYDFAYAGRDVVNQAAKVAPDVIKAAIDNINNIVKDRINQIISQGGKKVGRVLPILLRGATDVVYQTSFRLLHTFGKPQFNKIKRKISH